MDYITTDMKPEFVSSLVTRLEIDDCYFNFCRIVASDLDVQYCGSVSERLKRDM